MMKLAGINPMTLKMIYLECNYKYNFSSTHDVTGSFVSSVIVTWMSHVDTLHLTPVKLGFCICVEIFVILGTRKEVHSLLLSVQFHSLAFSVIHFLNIVHVGESWHCTNLSNIVNIVLQEGSPKTRVIIQLSVHSVKVWTLRLSYFLHDSFSFIILRVKIFKILFNFVYDTYSADFRLVLFKVRSIKHLTVSRGVIVTQQGVKLSNYTLTFSGSSFGVQRFLPVLHLT